MGHVQPTPFTCIPFGRQVRSERETAGQGVRAHPQHPFDDRGHQHRRGPRLIRTDADRGAEVPVQHFIERPLTARERQPRIGHQMGERRLAAMARVLREADPTRVQRPDGAAVISCRVVERVVARHESHAPWRGEGRRRDGVKPTRRRLRCSHAEQQRDGGERGALALGCPIGHQPEGVAVIQAEALRDLRSGNRGSPGHVVREIDAAQSAGHRLESLERRHPDAREVQGDVSARERAHFNPAVADARVLDQPVAVAVGLQAIAKRALDLRPALVQEDQIAGPGGVAPGEQQVERRRIGGIEVRQPARGVLVDDLAAHILGHAEKPQHQAAAGIVPRGEQGHGGPARIAAEVPRVPRPAVAPSGSRSGVPGDERSSHAGRLHETRVEPRFGPVECAVQGLVGGAQPHRVLLQLRLVARSLRRQSLRAATAQRGHRAIQLGP